MTTETPRVALFVRLTEVLGPEHASTLMTFLPTDEPATRSDVNALGERMNRFEDRLNQYDVRFDHLHEAMRQQTRNFILATSGMMLTLSAIAFGAAALI